MTENENFQPFDSSSRPKLNMRVVGRGWRWWWSVLRFRHGTYVTVPFVTTDEDGEVAYAVGHWDRRWFIQALWDNAKMDGWAEQLEDVDRKWLNPRHTYRAERFPDDEAMPECPPDTVGAVRFTECQIYV